LHIYSTNLLVNNTLEKHTLLAHTKEMYSIKKLQFKTRALNNKINEINQNNNVT